MMETSHDDRTVGRALVSGSDTQNHRDLVEFLGREFARSKERACVEVSLVQAPPGSRGQELRTWHRDENPDLFDQLGNVESLATLMLEISKREAGSRGVGRHRFVVRTTQHLRSTAQHAFHLIVDPEEEFLGVEEQTDTKGQISQQMRHAEWAIKTMLTLVQTNTSSFQQQIRILSDQNHQLYEDRSQMLAQLESARAEQDERTMAMVLAERADDRKDKVLNKLLPLAPVALSRLVSKDAPPGAGVSALAPIVKELVKTLNEAQLGKLASTFSMEQRILFMEAIKIVQEMDAAEAKPQGDDGDKGGAGSAAASAPP